MTTALATRQPKGIRPLSADVLKSDQIAQSFKGLPEGMTRWKLAAALRGAARLLDLSAGMLRLLEYYIDCTYDIDWTSGSEPIITRPLTETAEQIGRSERQIRNIERALVERGLLTWRDSANHHRRGKRDARTRRLLVAYGPSLAPMAARATEILALAAQARAETATRRRLRLAIAALRRRSRSALEALEQTGQPQELTSAQQTLLTRRLPAHVPLITLTDHRDRLHHLSSLLENTLRRVTSPDDRRPPSVEVTSEPETCSRPITDTCNQDSINGYNGQTTDQPMSKFSLGNEHRLKNARPTTLSLHTLIAVAGPTFKDLLGQNPSWHDFIDAGQQTSQMIGIEQDQWTQSCSEMGRITAATAILLMEHGCLRENHDKHGPIRNPRAYLTGLIRYHHKGQLNIERSIKSLAIRSTHPGNQTATVNTRPYENGDSND